MIMNIINAICLNTINLYDTPQYRLFKKRKIKNNIKELENKLLEENIFDVSDNIIEVLLQTSNDFKADHNIIMNGSCIKFVIEVSTFVEYSPIFHRFSVVYGDNYFKFDVSRNTNPPDFIKSKWDSIEKDILSFYIDIVEDVAFELL